MWAGPRRFGFLLVFSFVILVLAVQAAWAAPASWRGILRDADGHPIASASIELHAASGGRDYSVKTSATGDFLFSEVAEGGYTLRVTVGAKNWDAASPVAFKDDTPASGVLELSANDAIVRVITSGGEGKRTQGSGGENLSSGEVSSLPLNERDFKAY